MNDFSLHTQPTTTTPATLLDALADALEIPPARYESADRSYKSIGTWLARPSSSFAQFKVDVYTQGSFRLGTVIRPVSNEEAYDLDVICEIKIPKTAITQAQLQDQLGDELAKYAEAHDLAPPKRCDHCWTLSYADDAQFRMDLVPSIPDSERQRRVMSASGLNPALANNAIAITDSEHPHFRMISDEWPISNPNGYAEWFRNRMETIFESRKRAMVFKAEVNIARIPEYRVKTPLQSAVQILKRHRDMRFSESTEVKPSSIVITTLAAHAYGQEADIADVLTGILSRMARFIELRGKEYWIANPADPRENLADSWQTDPRLKEAFDDWLETAQIDFKAAIRQTDPTRFIDTLAPRMGRSLVEKAVGGHPVVRASQPIAKRLGAALSRIIDAPHRKPIAWPIARTGVVTIESTTFRQAGFRPRTIKSESSPLPKGGKLIFDAETNVKPPYRVYWQVVNTGAQARDARMLRGNIEEAYFERGHLSKEETTRYSGSHSVECFIVKDGLCVAQSGPFVVNIQ